MGRLNPRGDITLPEGETRSAQVIWSREGRGSYMPTPLVYRGHLYVLQKQGVLDLPGEDGDVFAVKAGPEFELLSRNPVGELLMSSPAVSDGIHYLRAQHHILAIGR